MAHCSDCDRTFANSVVLNQHYANSDSHAYCKPCGRLFKSWASRSQHWEASVTHSRTYCSLCAQNFDSQDDRWEHIKSSLKHPHLCIPCRLEVEGPTAHTTLHEHFRTAEAHEQTYCKTCEINFDTPDARWEHMDLSKDLHPYTCIPCRSEWTGTSGADDLRRHFETAEVHRDTYCLNCQRSFSSANDLREVVIALNLFVHLLLTILQHSRSHVEQDSICWGCDKAFRLPSAMIVHLETGSCSNGWRIQHLNAISEQCPEFVKNLIRERSPWFRAGAPRKFTKDTDQKTPPGDWTCHLCDMNFGVRTGLKDHLHESHSEKYPNVLRCPSCDSQFKVISGLLRHIETNKCLATYKEPSIAALISTLESEIKVPSSDFKRPAVEYRLECDPLRPSQLLVKVTEAGPTPDGPMQSGTKRKREDDEGHAFREKQCHCEFCRDVCAPS